MAKRKLVQNNLLKNSISAYFSAIEIHNKPNITYRYETVTLLMMNAWELCLKAFIRKYIKSKSIFENDEHTISFDKAVKYVDDYINEKIKSNSFLAIKENLVLLEVYRNNIVHFYNEALEPYIFMLIARAALNFVEFFKLYFKKDIIVNEGLFIMPLGFKLPFKPEDFLTKNSANYISSAESKSFIDKIVKVISDLKDANVEDSVVLGFSIYLESVKKITNSDLLIAITSKEEASTSFTKVNKVQLSSNPDAQPVYISDEELFKLYPLLYMTIQSRCKELYTDFSANNTFHDLIVAMRGNPIYSNKRPPHPASKSKNVSYIYSERIFETLDKYYTRKSDINTNTL